jgi:hypothetical protein
MSGMLIADFSHGGENYSDIDQPGGTIILLQAFYGSSGRAR